MADLEFVGSSLHLQWMSTAPAGTITLNTEFRTFVYTPSIEFVDRTAGADTARKRLVSFADGNARLTMLMQSSMSSADIALLGEGVIGTLIWGEAGSVSTYPKVTLPAISQGLTRTTAYNDVVQLDVSWQQNGARVLGTF